MLPRTLTSKILLAVGATVAAVIAIYTFFVIRVQSVWWTERTESQNLIAATMVHEYLNGVMLSDRHVEVEQFLQQLQHSGEIRRGRIVRRDGTVVFSTEAGEAERVRLEVPAELLTQRQTVQGLRRAEGQAVSVVMRPVISMDSCRTCHREPHEVLGAIVLEKSLAPALASIAANRNLLIAHGAVIFLLVGAVLWLLIVRLVKQPVESLVRQMRRVQQGDLGARADDRRGDEIGELARGFNAMVQSIETARRQLDESHRKQIQQADKLASIGELAAGIAHEIRNPLAGIGAAVEVLAENGGGNGAYQEVAGEIRNQIQRLNRTLRDLLDFARPREPQIAPCEVHDLIRPMLALIRPDAQKHRIQIREDFTPELPPLWADAQQVQQAILNVLLNAIQAMPQGGVLTVSTRAANGSVRISIRDTGTGIPPENQGKIFSPFYTTKHQGTGLGLAITRAIIEKHGGTIRVESEVGRGTMFLLELPRQAAQEAGTAPAGAGPAGGNPAEGTR